MHAHVEAVLRRFDEAHAALHHAVATVPEEMRQQRPGPERWSVAEVLEHISAVETMFARRIGDTIASAMAAGLGPENDERLPLRESIGSMMRDRSRRREAPEPTRPTGQLDAAAAWNAVERTREQVRVAIAQADGLALGSVTHTHPFFGSLTAYQWVELMAGHRERHAMQIREAVAPLA